MAVDAMFETVKNPPFGLVKNAENAGAAVGGSASNIESNNKKPSNKFLDIPSKNQEGGVETDSRQNTPRTQKSHILTMGTEIADLDNLLEPERFFTEYGLPPGNVSKLKLLISLAVEKAVIIAKMCKTFRFGSEQKMVEPLVVSVERRREIERLFLLAL